MRTSPGIVTALTLVGIGVLACTDATQPDDVAGPSFGKGQDKVTICHKGKNTLTVGAPALAAHLAHGDTQGACEQGGFLGKQIRGTGESVAFGKRGDHIVTVGPGAEFVDGINGLWCCTSIDVTDNQIVITFLSGGYWGGSGGFNGYVFRDPSNNIPPIVGVTVDPSSTFPPTSVSFTADEIRVHMGSTSTRSFSLGQFALLNVEF